MGYDVPRGMLLEQVDDCEQLFVFLSLDVWAQFSQTQSYMQFKTRHLSRDVDLQKTNYHCLSLKRGSLFMGTDVVLLLS